MSVIANLPTEVEGRDGASALARDLVTKESLLFVETGLVAPLELRDYGQLDLKPGDSGKRGEDFFTPPRGLAYAATRSSDGFALEASLSMASMASGVTLRMPPSLTLVRRPASIQR
jgi:hypothetical protein